MTGAAEFGRRTARAATWAFLSVAGGKVITLISLTLLARLLAPREFGLLAFALTYIVYVETIGDLGSGTALVYWPDRRDEAAQVTFLINLSAGIFWCGITLLLAPFIADLFNAPQGTGIVRVLSFSFLIRYLGTTHHALMRKDLRFRDAAIPELALALVKMVVALALAWQGFGAWSLVWGHLTGMLAETILLWTMIPWRPTWSFPRDLVKPMLAYGRGIVFVNVLASIQHQTDLLMISRWQGLTALGLYQLAGKIPEATVSMIYRVASDVLMPAFSRVAAAGESTRVVYLAAARYVGAATLPIACGLAVLSQPFVLLFFGPQWAAAAPIVSALAVLSGFRALAAQPGDVLKATGRVSLLARLGLARTILIVIAVVIAARWSALAVAVSLVIVDGIATIIAFTITSRVMDISLREVGSAFLPSLSASAAMTAALLAWLRWGPDLALLVEVMAAVALGGVVYLTVLSVTDRRILGEVRQIFAKRSEKGG